MKSYIMEYRTKENKPLNIIVEASGKKEAIKKARKEMKTGEYLVETPRRMFVGTGLKKHFDN